MSARVAQPLLPGAFDLWIVCPSLGFWTSPADMGCRSLQWIYLPPIIMPIWEVVFPVPDLQAVEVNALSLGWSIWNSISLFPPVLLLSRHLPLLWGFRGQGILIALFHAKAAWFPRLALKFSRLDTMMTALRTSGFSEHSIDDSRQANRESTIHQYQTVCQYFLDILLRTGIPSSDMSGDD